MRDIRIAIIGGGGFMGTAHSRAYDLASSRPGDDFRIIKDTLVDVDLAAAEASAERLGWQHAATDWRQVVAREDIDAIDICTPPQTHAEIAIAALRVGKNVFCEKPITNDLDEAEKMADVAVETGLVNQVGYNYRNSAAARYARKLIDDGEIGDILQMRLTYVMDGGWLGDPGWRRQKSSGGSGALGDIGSHIIDLAEYLAGPVASVIGDTVSYSPVAGGAHDVDDAGVFIARFVGGALGSFSYSLRAWGQKNRITFEVDGTRGALAFDWNHRDELQVLLKGSGAADEGLRRVIMSGAHEGVWFDLGGVGSGYLEASANQLSAFAEAIATGGVSQPDFRHGARIQRVVEAVDESRVKGSWVSL